MGMVDRIIGHMIELNLSPRLSPEIGMPGWYNVTQLSKP